MYNIFIFLSIKMPFTPVGKGKYKSPSGKVFTKKQVKMYYATDGFKKVKNPLSSKKK